jgi:hypothetical protein
VVVFVLVGVSGGEVSESTVEGVAVAPVAAIAIRSPALA